MNLIPYDFPITRLLQQQFQEEEHMAYQERAMKAYAHGVTNFRTEIEFTKTGGEISKSIEGVLLTLNTKLEKCKSDIAEICKRREIDPKEVIEAGSDEQAVGTYSMKAETNMGPRHSNALVRELQEDLTNLRRFGMMVESYNGDISSLQRIQKNIDEDANFKLSFDELTNFGF
jgi:hypothetical protein